MSVCYCLVSSEPSPYKELIYHSIMVVEVWAITLGRLRFYDGILSAIIIIVLFFNAVNYYEVFMTLLFFGRTNFVIILMALITLVGCYFREKIARVNYIKDRLINYKNIILEKTAH